MKKMLDTHHLVVINFEQFFISKKTVVATKSPHTSCILQHVHWKRPISLHFCLTVFSLSAPISL